jgi:3'-phosphoadenosine 5'-phosphosulfate sulfotransferase (PAPS reductase)/FAD synthetase
MTTNNDIKKTERHILALSGGKDSAALAVYMRDKYPELEMEYVFTDSGCELPETYEFLERIRAVLNIDITVVKSEKNFDYWLKYYKGVLPSPQNRWCTRHLKLEPFEAYIGDDIVFSYVAIRADEKRKGYKSTKGNIVSRHPFVENGIVLNDVINILNNAGLGLPRYYGWRKRSGCYFCFYQTDNEWKGLREKHPVEFEKACSYEENHSDCRIYTWRGKNKEGYQFLRDLKVDQKKEVITEDSNDNKLVSILRELTLSNENGILS